MYCYFPSSESPGRTSLVAQIDESDGGSFEMMNPPNYPLDSNLESDQDFWNPSILASTNWLEAIDLDGFDTTIPAFPLQESPGFNILDDNRGARSSIQESPKEYRTPASDVGPSHSSQYGADGNDPIAQHGSYYVDGEPARHTRGTKRRKTLTTPQFQELGRRFDLTQPACSGARLERVSVIDDSEYCAFRDAYLKYCHGSSVIWPDFMTMDFPTKPFFDDLVGLFRTNFNDSLPFIHISCFSKTSLSWIMLAAIASIGSQYLESGSKHVFNISMHEFNRRILSHLSEEVNFLPAAKRTEFAQATLLHSVGAAYSGDVRLSQRAISRADDLAMVFQTAMQESDLQNLGPSSLPQETDLDSKWHSWIRKEAAIRLAYSAWLVDCMRSYHFQQRTAMKFAEGSIPLPCHEKLWTAPTSAEWSAICADQDVSKSQEPALTEAMEELYIGKFIPTHRGEFARILMIHALFRRSWDIEAYFEQPVSQWEPNARRERSTGIFSGPPVWLPSVPTYIRWQNSSCDALDILHWQANAAIGKACGVEHPTVLHLHIARIILLVPYDSLVKLARRLAGVRSHGDRRSNAFDSADALYGPEGLSLRKWAIHHQYKARLAVIHAGVAFWHIRRHSTDAFYEAPAIALSALTLWAFGTFAKQTSAANRPANLNAAQTALASNASRSPRGDRPAARSSNTENSVCEIILLDRPTDDELVQHFIKNGGDMQAHISGIGDLYNPESPGLVLQQGCRLLKENAKYWGVAREWQHVLERLEEAQKNIGRKV